mgnify:CR=1 FL=1
MVNASLNWSSICGIAIVLISLPWAVISGFKISRILKQGKDRTGAQTLVVVWNLLVLFSRTLLLPLIGGILFFQGWRLDPILQFGQFLLVILLILESGGSIFTDFMNWRNRDVTL